MLNIGTLSTAIPTIVINTYVHSTKSSNYLTDTKNGDSIIIYLMNAGKKSTKNTEIKVLSGKFVIFQY